MIITQKTWHVASFVVVVLFLGVVGSVCLQQEAHAEAWTCNALDDNITNGNLLALPLVPTGLGTAPFIPSAGYQQLMIEVSITDADASITMIQIEMGAKLTFTRNGPMIQCEVVAGTLEWNCRKLIVNWNPQVDGLYYNIPIPIAYGAITFSVITATGANAGDRITIIPLGCLNS